MDYDGDAVVAMFGIGIQEISELELVMVSDLLKMDEYGNSFSLK